MHGRQRHLLLRHHTTKTAIWLAEENLDSEERETLHNELLKKEDFAAALFRTSWQKSHSDSKKMEEWRDGP